MKQTKKAIWLKVDGKINTISGHAKARGMPRSTSTTVAKRYKCKPSEVPLSGWKAIFGDDCEFCERPENWKMIMYGDERGSQKNRKLGQPINYPERKKVGPTMRYDLAFRFATMKLSNSPKQWHGYY